MSKIILTASVAQAIEIMLALLANQLDGWFMSRSGFPTGEPLSMIVGDLKKKPAQFFLKRIHAFSATLRKFRIMEIVPGVAEGDDFPIDRPMVRVVDFHLGNDTNPEEIIVRIHLERDEETGDQILWNGWELSIAESIVCVKHPDSSFVGDLLDVDTK